MNLSRSQYRRALLRSARVVVSLGAVTTLIACDIPTELPHWNTLWMFPVESTSIAVSTLLPDEISVTSGDAAFEMTLQPTPFSRSLGEMCSECAAFHGFIVPKPAFDDTFGSSIPLPADVVSAALVGGQIEVRLDHDFSFDPLRPSASARGFVVVTARSGTTMLARDSINGQTTPMPPGAVLSRTLQLAQANITAPLDISVRIFSPAGDPVQIDANAPLNVTATAQQVRVSSAQVRVASRTISTSQVDLDLEDVDSEVTERVKEGALHLDLENPFDVSGTFELRIAAPGTTIVRPLQLQPGASTQRVALSGDELRSILGRSGVTLVVTGTVSSPPGGIIVRPTDRIGIGTRLELTIGSKEN